MYLGSDAIALALFTDTSARRRGVGIRLRGILWRRREHESRRAIESYSPDARQRNFISRGAKKIAIFVAKLLVTHRLPSGLVSFDELWKV